MVEYSEHIAHFEKLKDEGETTPLDEIPELDIVEEWFYSTYNRLRMLSSSQEGLISIADYNAYFATFPLIHDFHLTLTIIHIVDIAVFDFRSEKRKKKAAAKKRSAPPPRKGQRR